MNLLSGAEIYCPFSVLESVRIKEFFFLKKMYENFVGALQTVRNIEDHRGVRTERFNCICLFIIYRYY